MGKNLNGSDEAGLYPPVLPWPDDIENTEGSSLISRKLAIQILAVAATIIIARLAFDLTSAAAYVYPELDLGQKSIVFIFFVVAVSCVLMLALVRLFQGRLLEGVALLIICYIPFSFDDVVDRHFWKFRIHRAEYQSIMQADPSSPPKFRVFDWGNRNTTLGGGVIFEAIVYDESGDIARWSPEWIEPRSNPSPEDRWITQPSESPSCKRRTESFGGHFYYVSEEC
ncbi:MAG: hypothetical protein QOH96_487 [Blastocatellia bacterium]|nr:hypothetical protein [Blastocatellia bacterium]